MKLRTTIFPLMGSLVLALGLAGSTQAVVINVDDFTLIEDAIFIDVGLIELNGIPVVSGVTSASGGGINITGNPSHVGVLSLGASANPSASDPGDGHGWAAGSIVNHRFDDLSVVLDFDQAIAGFGVSFLHFLNPKFEPFNFPGTLEVFDMPGGAGNLIGRINSSGGTNEHVDFVGIWTDELIIRSAVLSVVTGSFAVDGYAVTQTLISVHPTTAVDINIKPGNKYNIINPRAKGIIWVAVLSDTGHETPFDPLSQVDIPTVEFGPDGANVVRYKVKDVNKDGLGDLLLRFNIPQTGIACGDTDTVLSGETFDGRSFIGTDYIKTVGCKKPDTSKKKKHNRK